MGCACSATWFETLRRLSDRQAARLSPASESLGSEGSSASFWLSGLPPLCSRRSAYWATWYGDVWVWTTKLEVPFARACTDPKRWPSVKGESSPALSTRGPNDWCAICFSYPPMKSLSRPVSAACRESQASKPSPSQPAADDGEVASTHSIERSRSRADPLRREADPAARFVPASSSSW